MRVGLEWKWELRYIQSQIPTNPTTQGRLAVGGSLTGGESPDIKTPI